MTRSVCIDRIENQTVVLTDENEAVLHLSLAQFTEPLQEGNWYLLQINEQGTILSILYDAKKTEQRRAELAMRRRRLLQNR